VATALGLVDRTAVAGSDELEDGELEDGCGDDEDDEEGADETLKQIEASGARGLIIQADVSKLAEVQSLVDRGWDVFGSVDILVNNAGMAHANLGVDQLPYATWREVIETNLSGMFLVTQAALPLMREGSVIVNNLSVAARRVFTGSSAYVASKHGALGFTDTLREELRPRGIRVIAVLPGATDTAIWESFWPDAPRKKMISPEIVARAVVDALKLPPESTVEELTIRPSAGTL